MSSKFQQDIDACVRLADEVSRLIVGNNLSFCDLEGFEPVRYRLVRERLTQIKALMLMQDGEESS